MFRAPTAITHRGVPIAPHYPPAAAPAPRRRRRVPWIVLRWLLILGVWGALGSAVILIWFARDLPRPEDALDAVRRPSLVIEDDRGRTVATYGDLVGQPLRLSQLPRALPEAVVAIEDRRFWSHWGLDLRGMARAAFVDIFRGHIAQGGSTLTQQVAKNLFLTNARTFRRKVQEVLLTLWLERHFSKAEILEIWLNRVYLGSGAWGMDAASRLYFGIPATRLSLWQAAVLAGLPRAPSHYNPRTDPKAAAERAREVLAAMVETGVISQAEADDAARRIKFPGRVAGGGWFADWAANQAQQIVPTGTDAVLRSTLDAPLQAVAESRLAALLDGPGRRVGATQGAVVVLDADTGAVRALVGGRDYAQGAYNRATIARRQPGSAFKLFVWLAALEHGMRPDDTVLDAPLRIGNWSPVDFEHGFRGNVTLEEALAQSLNTASVRLMQRAGGPAVVASVAHRLGIADKLPDLPSLALGTGEVDLLEMSCAYAAVFNGGHLVTPRAFDTATTDGRAFALTHEAGRQVVAPEDARMMVQMMAAVVARGTGRGAAIPGRFVAGKTGTTQDNRDAWFIGGTGRQVIGVWIGRDDDRPMKGVMGGGLPTQLFRQVAMAAH
jgi:penicillin-binding protein 1A